MSTLGERIRCSREAKGLLQNDLAKLVGVKSSGVISNWENDLNKPDAEKIVRLCNVLDISASFLLDYYGKSSFEFSSSEEEHIKKYRNLDDYGKETVDIVLERETIRVKELQKKENSIKELQKLSTSTEFAQELGIPSRILQYFRSVSAGTGQVIFDDVYSERITIPDIPEHRRVAYAVKVSGNSMEPLYTDGDMLLIEPTCSIDTGEIGIFNVDGQAYVKKLGDGELISLNTEYVNIELTDDSRCMGRVVDKFSEK